MIATIRFLIAIAFQCLIASAAPVGICLHAHGPDAPADKIECFEFEKVERTAGNYQFFTAASSVNVTAYRLRGTILYKPDLGLTHPEFSELLKMYEETARATPSTRPFLNPRILAMRSQVAEAAKQTEIVALLPNITLANGTRLTGCKMIKIENGVVSIRHQDGVRKVSIKELKTTEKNALNATAEGWSLEEPFVSSKDTTGTFAKIIFKNGILLKKAKFKEVTDGNLLFLASGKSVSVLGEEVVKSLAPVKKEASPEPPDETGRLHAKHVAEEGPSDHAENTGISRPQNEADAAQPPLFKVHPAVYAMENGIFFSYGVVEAEEKPVQENPT